MEFSKEIIRLANYIVYQSPGTRRLELFFHKNYAHEITFTEVVTRLEERGYAVDSTELGAARTHGLFTYAEVDSYYDDKNERNCIVLGITANLSAIGLPNSPPPDVKDEYFTNRKAKYNF